MSVICRTAAPGNRDRTTHYSTEYLVLPQDPILGIREQHISPAIDIHNWRHKGFVVQQEDEKLYVYIAQGEVTKLNRKVFCPTGYSPGRKRILWRHQFATPEEAVSWVNGQTQF
ncbi:hypothetical protein ACVBEJ_13165 [Porticoccus sp. GXU_MW_L64]